MQHTRTLGICLLAVLLCSGCVKNYRITTELEQPLNSSSNCQIGAITDALPADFEAEDKPTAEHINMLKNELAEQIADKNLFATISEINPNAEYEITGAILDYKKGSGFLRVLFGVLAGGAKLTVELKLQDRARGTVLFSGNFTQSVTSWGESGDMTYERVAKDFVKAIEKELERLRKQG